MENDSIDNIIVDERTALLADEDNQNKSYNSVEIEQAICGGYQTNNTSKDKLIKVVCVSSLFFIIEFAGGLISGSLALLSDSFHLLSDVIGFLISLIAVIVSQRKATKKYSFGYHRAEIIGALLSLVFIWVLTIGLVFGAIERLKNPVEINANVMLITAIAGVIINIILAVTLEHGGHDHAHGHSHSHSHDLFHSQGHEHEHEHDHVHVHEHNEHEHNEHEHNEHEHEHEHDHVHVHEHNEHEHEHDNIHLPSNLNPHHETDSHSEENHQHNEENSGNSLVENYKKENINVKAAIIHIVGDLISSIGVVIAATIIYFDPSKVYIDPICTFIFSIIVIFTTINLLKQTLSVIMESTPEHIDSDEVRKDIKEIRGIVDIHDLHIWNITIGKPAIAAHISVKNEGSIVDEYQRILNNAQYILCTKYGIHHTTLQIEFIHEDSNLLESNNFDNNSYHSSSSHSSHKNSNHGEDISIDIQPSADNYREYSSIHCKSQLCS